jgi:hypothetical protein
MSFMECKYISACPAEQVGLDATLCACNPGVIGWDTSCSGWSFSRIYLVSSGKRRKNVSIKPKRALPNSFQFFIIYEETLISNGKLTGYLIRLDAVLWNYYSL